MDTEQSFKLQSDEIKQIASALSKASSSIKPALKSAENPFFKHNYADLKEIDHACRSALTENELAISQVIMPIDGIPFLVTILMHSSGEWIKSYYPITYDKSTPQAIGSGVTYARRYSLAAICNVVTEDDDGEAATKREKEIPKKYPDIRIDLAKEKSPKEILIDRMNKAGDLLELQKIINEAPSEVKNDKFDNYTDMIKEQILSKAGDLKELQLLANDAPKEMQTDQFAQLVKKLESKFVTEMTKEIFDLEPQEVKPTFEETAIKHSKTLKPKGAK